MHRWVQLSRRQLTALLAVAVIAISVLPSVSFDTALSPRQTRRIQLESTPYVQIAPIGKERLKPLRLSIHFHVLPESLNPFPSWHRSDVLRAPQPASSADGLLRRYPSRAPPQFLYST